MLLSRCRSAPPILQVAEQALTSDGRPSLFRELIPHHKHHNGTCVEMITARNEYDEAEVVRSKVTSLLRQGTPPSEIAVLYRKTTQAKLLEEQFIKSGNVVLCWLDICADAG